MSAKKWHGILEGPFALSGEIKKKHLIVESNKKQRKEEAGRGGRRSRGRRRRSSAVSQSVRRRLSSTRVTTVRFTSFLLTLTEAIPAEDHSLTKSQ